MPTNLPPEYFRAEERYRAAKSPEEKISLLEELIATVPKHKGTDKLRADLRRKLGQLRDVARARKKTGGHASLFHIEKEGAARAVLVGPANTGKSALLNVLTHASPKIADSPYTTWCPMPGMMEHKNVQIQLIDTPPMSKAHLEAELPGLIHTADLIIVVVDLRSDPLQQLEETIDLLMDNGIIPACRRETRVDRFNSITLPILAVVNKTDQSELEEDFHIFLELMEENCPAIGVSASSGHNLESLKQTIFEELQIIRVFAKPPGAEPDFTAPFALKKGATIEEFAAKVHKDFVVNLKTARVWGQNVFDGQPVSRDHILEDGDVVEMHT